MSSASAETAHHPHRPLGRSIWTLAAFLAAATLTAIIGGLASSDAEGVYTSLQLPAFAPPPWLFGPAWAVLYVLIAVSGWLVYRRRGWDRSLTLWAAQLVLNAAWTPLFFGASMYTAALVDITVLAGVVAATTILFARRHRLAAALMIPYLVWLGYAGALNAGIVLLNG